jgi:hypothetical protein
MAGAPIVERPNLAHQVTGDDTVRKRKGPWRGIAQQRDQRRGDQPDQLQRGQGQEQV